MRSMRMLTVLVAALAVTACGGPADSPVEEARAAAVVTTSMGGPGTFLTDGDGFTLYLFAVDSPGLSSCTGTCLDVWPPVLSDGEPVATGSADAMLLGTLTREDGTRQVTYAGWPLYRYVLDGAAGDVTGQGVDGVWFVVSPAGEPLGAEPPLDAERAEDVSDDEDSDPYGYGY